MEYTQSINDGTCTVVMSGSFTFADHNMFKNILDLVDKGTLTKVEINLSDLNFIDSAGMGLLLLLKESTDKKSIKLILISPQGHPEKIFRISKFYEIFNIIE